MAQDFPPQANFLARLTIVSGAFGLPLFVWLALLYTRSSYGTNARVMREQPVPFSHQHHVGMLGIDCRYCHNSVETSSVAGLPATSTCMNCHSQIWVGSQMLAPIRDSFRTGKPIHWERVYNLPGFVYFDHSIHVQKGIGCSTCHGQIDQMPLTYQTPSLLMDWCLDCHRHPEREIRPREAVFDMHYAKPDDQQSLGRRLVEQYGVKDSQQITSCSTCHR